MADLSSISKDICKHKNLEKNLQLYLDNMITLYGRFSYIKLSMNYYTFADMMSEDGVVIPTDLRTQFEQLNGIMKKALLKSCEEKDIKAAMEQVQELRNDIMKTMEIVTAYVDRFSVFEHILNIIEFRFSQEPLDLDYYNGQFANDIMNYILSERDNVVINAKISDLVAQLPMRLTKNKFFEYVKDAFALYQGQEVNTLQDFVYMIDTVSGIHMPQGFEAQFPDLNEILHKLSGLSYKDMEEEAFHEALNMLTYSVSFITKVSDLYVSFMEIINDVLVILFAKKYGYYEMEELQTSLSIIEDVMNANHQSQDLLDDLTDKFISFEGKQERIYSTISSNDYVIDEIINSYSEQLKELELTDAFETLKNISLLSSGSNFVSLNEQKDHSIVTEELVETYFNRYYEAMTAVFKENAQIYNRAVMALVLAGLPVFFNNTDEIMRYITTSLSQCSDIAERKACLSLIRSLMEE